MPGAVLNVMTWNVRHSTPARDVVDTVVELIERHLLDIVMLQEVTPLSIVPPRLLVPRALARATGWRLIFGCHPRPYPSWLEGVAILTALPVDTTTRVRVSANRTYVQTAIAHPELGTCTAGVVHLSDPASRAQEITRIAAHAPRSRTVLAGDFNLSPSDPILMLALADYAPDDRPGVDHVYVSGDLTIVASRTEPTTASDHDPVIGSVALGEPR